MTDRHREIVETMHELHLELFRQQGDEIEALRKAIESLRKSHEIIGKLLDLTGKLMRSS